MLCGLPSLDSVNLRQECLSYIMPEIVLNSVKGASFKKRILLPHSGKTWSEANASKIPGKYGNIDVHYIGKNELVQNKQATGKVCCRTGIGLPSPQGLHGKCFTGQLETVGSD